MSQKPHYMDKQSTQTLREGLAEYYAFNSHITDPATQPTDFGKILLAHDVGHVIYGCDTGMYDELKILPLFWWTSECTFRTYLKMKNSPAVDVMYEDMFRRSATPCAPTKVSMLLPIFFELVSCSTFTAIFR